MKVPFGKKLHLPFKFLDANGAVATIDTKAGMPTVTTSAGTVLEVVAAGDGFSAKVDPAGFVGAFSVAGEADVDRGDGVKTLPFSLGDHEALAAEVVAPEADHIELGEPTVED